MFLFDLFNYFGFGQHFKKAIQTLYSDYNSSVKLAWGTTHRFLPENKTSRKRRHYIYMMVLYLYQRYYTLSWYKYLQGSEYKTEYNLTSKPLH